MQIGHSNSAAISAFTAAAARQTHHKSKPLDAEKATTHDPADKEKRTEKNTHKEETNPQQQRQINELKNRDREVRAHEAAHKAAAGSLAKGGASFSYTRGPDGKLYAVGGEVSIDTSPVAGDPQATLQKANQIRAAALAPAQPSAQDRAVAAQAGIMAAEARAELTEERREETKQQTSDNEDSRNNSSATEKYQTVANNHNEPHNKINLHA